MGAERRNKLSYCVVGQSLVDALYRWDKDFRVPAQIQAICNLYLHSFLTATNNFRHASRYRKYRMCVRFLLSFLLSSMYHNNISGGCSFDTYLELGNQLLECSNVGFPREKIPESGHEPKCTLINTTHHSYQHSLRMGWRNSFSTVLERFLQPTLHGCSARILLVIHVNNK